MKYLIGDVIHRLQQPKDTLLEFGWKQETGIRMELICLRNHIMGLV